MSKITIKREELYELVWSKPATEITHQLQDFIRDFIGRLIAQKVTSIHPDFIIVVRIIALNIIHPVSFSCSQSQRQTGSPFFIFFPHLGHDRFGSQKTVFLPLHLGHFSPFPSGTKTCSGSLGCSPNSTQSVNTSKTLRQSSQQ